MRRLRASALAVLVLVLGAPAASAAARFGVGETVLEFTDHTRSVTLPGVGRLPRTLPTVIRYPAASPAAVDLRGAHPAAGRFGLVVFAHGFAVTPAIYTSLLRAWVQAGYVVAAPIFPLTNAEAPGGPDEADLVNQPADMSFVITRLLAVAARRTGPLAGLIAPREIAVAGQSDGGSTALDTADDHDDRDRRVDAAVILSGAEMPGLDSDPFALGSPPLLAVQGTADPTNWPSSTYRYFRLARPPKFLLRLLGARHLGPYTTQQPQLAIVEGETIAFLNRYLRHLPGSRAAMWSAGDVAGLAALSTSVPAAMTAAFDLERFVSAQSGGVYDGALAQLRAGRKTGHWMWFVFPQLAGLGRTPTARHYAIVSIQEARAYLEHPVLGPRLRECAAAVAGLPGDDPEAVFGGIDALKLRSSMTLFARAAPEEPVFAAVLARYYAATADPLTLQLLGDRPR